MNILGIGTATPEHFFSQDDRHQVAEHYFQGTRKERRVLPVLYERTGVKKRHSVILNASEGDLADRQTLFKPVTTEEAASDVNTPAKGIPSTEERMQVYDREAWQLAVKSVQNVLEETGVNPASITHTVTVSCTGFSAPGFDLQLIDAVPLSPAVQRTHVGFMGCHGGLNGLRVANAITTANPEAVVLLCATELCSLHHQYSGNADQLVANALFADGSMAVIGVGDDSEHASKTGWFVADSASYVIPESQDSMTWMVGDTGFRMSLAPTLPSLIQTEVAGWMEQWLSKHGVSPRDIQGWAVHPGGPRILSSFQEAMQLEPEALHHSFDVLAEMGNMSSATVFFILKRMIAEGNRLPCVAIGFGPGITIEAALLMPQATSM